MRIEYQVLPPPRRHPLPRRSALALVRAVRGAYPEIAPALRLLRFAWNARTTQEGRIVRRGRVHDIRLNFTLREGTSRLLDASPRWLRFVRSCGGRPDEGAGVVRWPGTSAARYAAFLVLHEIAHVVYAGRVGDAGFQGSQGATAEERFCDRWALRHLPLVTGLAESA